MRYTVDPASFIPPTLRTIEHIAKREGLGELTHDELDFVWDLLAKTAGADVREFDEVEAQADAAVHAMEEAQAFLARGNNAAHFDEWRVTRQFEYEYHLHQHQRYSALVEVDLNQLPGYNKPTQAVRLLWLFRAMQRLWILHIISIEYGNFVQVVADAVAMVEALSWNQMEMLEAFVSGDEPGEEAIVLGLELAVSGIQVDEMLRIARKLSELAELQGRAKLTPDPNGEEIVLRDIQELSELGRATQSAFTLPSRLRMQRAAMGELDVRDPRTRRAQKQLLFMVIDGSGSMLGDGLLGASRAAGIVMNRLEAVIKGDAELYLRFFDGALRKQEFHADSPASARELMRVISDPAQYLGGSTEFEETLRAASQRAGEILANRGLRDPEIVFVTDGEAYVPPLSVLDNKKLHAFQVGEEENHELSDLARQSGGVGVYIGLRDWETE
ncbi:MAG TPA: VWA domain-containing protein [Candidatus Saccharimonadales bacterium]|nr:VWA domain-containing protein [Candidatus Saccharimonadales bacterium]